MSIRPFSRNVRTQNTSDGYGQFMSGDINNLMNFQNRFNQMAEKAEPFLGPVQKIKDLSENATIRSPEYHVLESYRGMNLQGTRIVHLMLLSTATWHYLVALLEETTKLMMKVTHFQMTTELPENVAPGSDGKFVNWEMSRNISPGKKICTKI